ncbi:hypothetical protein TNCT_406441 [Trichonephila clavata]|uniref:Uncharacterized protein n=1 Tax=Trichonephila clavata TaxID=2740835 RepID=A0A8X6G628_TRICU|nr:hypothetical protein TNCT_406441 [Trichonephila clavata]
MGAKSRFTRCEKRAKFGYRIGTSFHSNHSTVRSANFKRELRNCLAPYREVLVELEKKATIENQCEDEPSEEDILPSKRRRVRRLISDSEDEC